MVKPWVKQALPGSKVLAAYMSLVNFTNKPIKLIGIESAAFESVEIHDMSSKNGVMNMAEIKELTLPAKGKKNLKPGGMHMMLIDPKKVYFEGDTLFFKIIL